MSNRRLPSFRPFQKSINTRWNEMSEKEIFTTDVTGDEVWELYLASFPEGSNPIFRERTLHDGSYDRQFIRQLGTLVNMAPDGTLTSIWDAKGLEYPYTEVCKAVAERVDRATVTGVWRTDVGKYSQEESFETGDFGNGKNVRTWPHLFGEVKSRHFTHSPGAVAGTRNTLVQVFKRGLDTITVESLQTILELIDNGALYRGPEFKDRVRKFLSTKERYDELSDREKQAFAWNTRTDDFRNTVIGTLATDISEGRELESAVKSFEQKVAPHNYKRPKPIVTEAMINKAMETINALGIESSLERRHARFSDITANDVLWVNGDTSGKLKGGVEDLLRKNAVQKNVEGQKMSFEDFKKDILPTAESIDLFFDNTQKNRLVSVTAGVHEDAPALFKWNNNLAWSYTGDVTDSIKDRVKSAGGSINCAFRVSLAWYNGDDLDIHCLGPLGHIYFGDRKGILDVDMNAGGVSNDQDPVENLAFNHMPDGKYLVYVNNYSKRQTRDPGFTIEIDDRLQTRQFHYSEPLRDGENVNALEIIVEKGQITRINISDKLSGSGISKEIWGINTETFVPVETILNSPNHWDGESIGNKHTFFILKDCVNPEPVRGIYNEYLKKELDEHRRVFELLGNKAKAPVTTEQLSGVGMSETNGQTVKLRVNGKAVYEVSL